MLSPPSATNVKPTTHVQTKLKSSSMIQTATELGKRRINNVLSDSKQRTLEKVRDASKS